MTSILRGLAFDLNFKFFEHFAFKLVFPLFLSGFLRYFSASEIPFQCFFFPPNSLVPLLVKPPFFLFIRHRPLLLSAPLPRSPGDCFFFFCRGPPMLRPNPPLRPFEYSFFLQPCFFGLDMAFFSTKLTGNLSREPFTSPEYPPKYL